MRSPNKAVVAATEQRLQTCMSALNDVSRVWLVAKMIHTLFESILGNKSLEERLQKAGAKRHAKRANKRDEPPPTKRKFDDMDLGFANGPAPQVSYERSRPQTPSLTPSRDVKPVAANGMHMPAGSPPMRQQHILDQQQQQQQQQQPTFSGAIPSRGNTRPTTPFNHNTFSYPGTPPELFLVTRNSPNISSDLWQNFQPDQLFPAETNLNVPFASLSPIQQHTLVDPQLSAPNGQQQGQQMMQGMPPATMSMPANGVLHTTLASHTADVSAWSNVDGMNQHPNMGSDDTWSNSSKGQGGGPIAPLTLNVEDWFVTLPESGPTNVSRFNFFGIQGDATLTNFP
jgi:hypothetical protein